MPPAVRRAIDRLVPARARPLLDLVVATARGAARDRVPGLGAEIAFWALLSLPPLLLLAAATAGAVGQAVGADVQGGLVQRIEELALQVFSPETVEAAIGPTLDAILQRDAIPIASVTSVATVFAASRGLRTLVHAVAIAYDQQESRPTWMARVLGIVYTVVAMAAGVVVIPLVVAGPRLGALVEGWLGVDLWLAEAWTIAYWPVSLVMVTLAIAALYHHAVPWSTPFRRELPGAALATVLGLAVNAGLRLYTQSAFGDDAVYAPLAAPLALLIWLWLQAMAVLLGAELNAAVEEADPVAEPAPDPPTLRGLGRRAVRGARRLSAGSRAPTGRPRPPGSGTARPR